MKYVAWVGFSVVFAFVFSVSSFAQEFSADVISRTADGKVSRSKLYQTPDKERFDSTVELGVGKAIETHMIIDRRGKLIYLIEPQQKTILVNHVLQLASNAAASGSNTNPCEELMKMVNPTVVKQQFVCKQVGHESVNGRSAEKWQMESAGLGNGPVFLWVDSQVKTAVKWTLADGSSGELQNIKVGPQPASLFELPADYRRQDLPQ
jgi:hypothetical protein